MRALRRGDARQRTSSGAGSSCEPARMASSALTVLSASDSDAAHRVMRRADPTEALETGPSARRIAAVNTRRAATRGRAASATTTGFRVSITGFMGTTSGVPRTRGASGSAEPRRRGESDVAAVTLLSDRQMAPRPGLLFSKNEEIPRHKTKFVERRTARCASSGQR